MNHQRGTDTAYDFKGDIFHKKRLTMYIGFEFIAGANIRFRFTLDALTIEQAAHNS